MPPISPRTTYRLQLTKDFTFDDAAAIVPYLKRLAISDLYSSPFLAARPGSTHGHDIVNHSRHRLQKKRSSCCAPKSGMEKC